MPLTTPLSICNPPDTQELSEKRSQRALQTKDCRWIYVGVEFDIAERHSALRELDVDGVFEKFVAQESANEPLQHELVKPLHPSNMGAIDLRLRQMLRLQVCSYFVAVHMYACAVSNAVAQSLK